jgi:hypothetical protein
MCNPFLFNCTPAHFPLLIDSAVERLHESEKTEVHLSQDALQYLYKYGDSHRVTFEGTLSNQNQGQLDKLSTALHARLKVALHNSKKKDARGRNYNPPRIDKDALEKALKSKPLLKA